MKNKILQKRLLSIGVAAVLSGLSNPSFSANIPELGSVYNPTKQYEIAMQLIDGQDTNPDFDHGLKWLKLAAAQQHPEALFQLGFYHEFGIDGVVLNHAKARDFYEKAAKQGHIASQINLSALFFREESSVFDHNSGYFWLKEAAKLGYPQAQYSLAEYYREQLDADPNNPELTEKVIHWLNQSANRSYKEAQYTLGTHYLSGELLPVDSKLAFKWFEKAAHQGDAPSQYNIALMYELGDGVEADEEKAIHWYKKSALQNEPGAQFNLGRKYLMGQGLKKDIERGLDLISHSAESGNPAALTLLANQFLLGQYIDRDYGEAFKLYLAAAEHDYPEAQYRLSLMFAKGQGVNKDEEKSVHWISKAAMANHPMAQYGLGAYLANGVGIEKDLFQAAYWLSLAAMQGQKHALESRDSVLKMLSHDELDTLNKQIEMVGSSQRPHPPKKTNSISK